jgi:hypothetical protein
VLIFLAISRPLEKKLDPSNSNVARWRFGLVVSFFAVLLGLPLVMIKELGLFIFVYRDLLNTAQLGIAEWLFGIGSSLVFSASLIFALCPIIATLVSKSQGSKGAESET